MEQDVTDRVMDRLLTEIANESRTQHETDLFQDRVEPEYNRFVRELQEEGYLTDSYK